MTTNKRTFMARKKSLRDSLNVAPAPITPVEHDEELSGGHRPQQDGSNSATEVEASENENRKLDRDVSQILQGAKNLLAQALNGRLSELGVSQSEVCRRYGISQPRLSELKREKLDKLSLETMFLMAARLGMGPSVTMNPDAE